MNKRDSRQEDRNEAVERGKAVQALLDRCLCELRRIEDIPHLSAGDVNAISATKGFVERAANSLDEMTGASPELEETIGPSLDLG